MNKKMKLLSVLWIGDSYSVFVLADGDSSILIHQW